MDNNAKNMRGAVEPAIDSEIAFSELLKVEQRQFLIDHGVVHSVFPGEVLCECGQSGDRVFILVFGEVKVSKVDGAQSVILGYLRQGEIFGEISALYHSPRVSTVTVSKPSVLLEIPGEILTQVVDQNRLLRSAIIKRYKRRITQTALRSVPSLRYLSDKAIENLIEYSSLVGIPAGNKILKEGESGDALYVVISGIVRVTHTRDGAQFNLAQLSAGDYFGEWSILTGAPRAASVTAVTPVEVVRLECDLFLDFIKDNPEVRDRIDLDAHNRHELTLVSG
ncbi:cyclic nucleotide-binding domain-containing protein [Beggiatoa alba]|nr:cyclic nucleotide-binding domain-containing protein [Beggiatoa alba]